MSVERMAILQKLRRLGGSNLQLAEASQSRLGIHEFTASKRGLKENYVMTVG